MLNKTEFFWFNRLGLVLKEASGIVEAERYLAVETTQGSCIFLELASLLEGTGGSSTSFVSFGFYRTQSYKKSHFILPLFLSITPYL